MNDVSATKLSRELRAVGFKALLRIRTAGVTTIGEGALVALAAAVVGGGGGGGSMVFKGGFVRCC